jgi:hypothetical protein
MEDEEKYIIKIELDTSNFVQGLTDVESKLKKIQQDSKLGKAVGKDVNDGIQVEMENTLNSLKAKLKGLQQELGKTDLGGEAFKNLNTQIKKVQDQMKVATKMNVQVDQTSLIAMRNNLSELKKQFAQMSATDRDSDIGRELLTNTAELNQEIKDLEQSYGDFQRSVGNYQGAFDQGVQTNITSLNSLQDEIKQNKLELQSMAVGSTEFNTMSSTIQEQEEHLRSLNQTTEQTNEIRMKALEGSKKLAQGFGDLSEAYILLAGDESDESKEMLKKIANAMALGKAIDGTITIIEGLGGVMKWLATINPFAPWIAGIALATAGAVALYNIFSKPPKVNIGELIKNESDYKNVGEAQSLLFSLNEADLDKKLDIMKLIESKYSEMFKDVPKNAGAYSKVLEEILKQESKIAELESVKKERDTNLERMKKDAIEYNAILKQLDVNTRKQLGLTTVDVSTIYSNTPKFIDDLGNQLDNISSKVDKINKADPTTKFLNKLTIGWMPKQFFTDIDRLNQQLDKFKDYTEYDTSTNPVSKFDALQDEFSKLTEETAKYQTKKKQQMESNLAVMVEYGNATLEQQRQYERAMLDKSFKEDVEGTINYEQRKIEINLKYERLKLQQKITMYSQSKVLSDKEFEDYKKIIIEKQKLDRTTNGYSGMNKMQKAQYRENDNMQIEIMNMDRLDKHIQMLTNSIEISNGINGKTYENDVKALEYQKLLYLKQQVFDKSNPMYETNREILNRSSYEKFGVGNAPTINADNSLWLGKEKVVTESQKEVWYRKLWDTDFMKLQQDNIKSEMDALTSLGDTYIKQENLIQQYNIRRLLISKEKNETIRQAEEEKLIRDTYKAIQSGSMLPIKYTTGSFKEGANLIQKDIEALKDINTKMSVDDINKGLTDIMKFNDNSFKLLENYSKTHSPEDSMNKIEDTTGMIFNRIVKELQEMYDLTNESAKVYAGQMIEMSKSRRSISNISNQPTDKYGNVSSKEVYASSYNKELGYVINSNQKILAESLDFNRSKTKMMGDTDASLYKFSTELRNGIKNTMNKTAVSYDNLAKFNEQYAIDMYNAVGKQMTKDLTELKESLSKLPVTEENKAKLSEVDKLLGAVRTKENINSGGVLGYVQNKIGYTDFKKSQNEIDKFSGDKTNLIGKDLEDRNTFDLMDEDKQDKFLFDLQMKRYGKLAVVYADFAKQGFDMYVEYENKKMEAEMQMFNAKQDAKMNRELKDTEGNSIAQENIRTKYAKLRADEEKKQFDAKQKNQITQVIMSTALGIAQSFAQGGLPGLIIGGIAGAAMAAVQIQTIKQQKFVPVYEKGGIIEGESHQGSNGGVDIKAEGGEFIINKNSTQKFRPILENLNSGNIPFSHKFIGPIVDGTQNTIILEISQTVDKLAQSINKVSSNVSTVNDSLSKSDSKNVYIQEKQITDSQKNVNVIQKNALI